MEEKEEKYIIIWRERLTYEELQILFDEWHGYFEFAPVMEK